jgi:HSP20 family protein
MPEVEVQEKDHEYELKVQLPGFCREDIELTRQDSILSLRGESQRMVDSPEGKREESVSFTRQFVLPDNAAEKLITAEFDAGELTVSIPKTVAPPVQRVAITMN